MPVSLALLVLVLMRSFSYTPDASYIPDARFSWFFVVGFLTHLILVLAKSFPYTPHASSGNVFLLHSPC